VLGLAPLRHHRGDEVRDHDVGFLVAQNVADLGRQRREDLQIGAKLGDQLERAFAGLLRPIGDPLHCVMRNALGHEHPQPTGFQSRRLGASGQENAVMAGAAGSFGQRHQSVERPGERRRDKKNLHRVAPSRLASRPRTSSIVSRNVQ
jgi:hypothetical protein